MSDDTAHINPNDTFWENVATGTRWGAYVTDIEKRAILKAQGLSGEPAAALEIGAEGGRWSKLLADLGWNMTCTDINQETLAICRKRISAANCILVKPEERKLPCKTESVSLLLCIEVAPVMQADWFVGEASRVLHHEGVMVGVFLNRLSFRGLFSHLRASFTGEYDFYRFSYPSWRMQLLRSGYSMLYEEGFCWFPLGRTSNSIFIPYLVRLEKALGLRKLPLVSPWIIFVAQKSSKEPPRHD